MRRHFAGLAVVLLACGWSHAQSASPPRERFQSSAVIYDWVTDSRGDRLRTFVSRPNASTGKVPAIFLVGWLSCDSVEYPKGETDAFGAIIWRLVEQSGMTPGQITAQHPDWKPFWYDEPDGQYGRPAAFYQQLQELNLGEAWEKVGVPVLVMHGTSDEIMSDRDSRAIADIVNRAHSGQARYVEVQDADHLLTVHGKLEDSVVPTMLQWMGTQAAP
jgi:pimeloyl-ACP methyl ester carboxylesterase